MNEEQFVIWFRGFSEAVRTAPTVDQWEVIKKRLDSVQERVYLNIPTIPTIAPYSPIKFCPSTGEFNQKISSQI